MVTFDVRRSDLVNKYIKRSIAIFVQRVVSIKIQIHWLQFNSIRLNSNQDSCIQRCVVITIYSFLESDVLFKYDSHNFGVRCDRSFISAYFWCLVMTLVFAVKEFVNLTAITFAL